MELRDKYTLALYAKAVEKIDADPSLIDVVLATLDRWGRRGGSESDREWRAILSRPWTEAREIILDPSEKGGELRKSSPVGFFLSNDERMEVYSRFSTPEETERFKAGVNQGVEAFNHIIERGHPPGHPEYLE